ncbi:hypothetical protein ElyMa_002247400 [Elysia marginata]|uniref:Secreted protein n=1 Tax=Elysia marginata TaxID=1093978 RepID=A0AAV4FWI1_9GAST|nr:hypothetical protein ElyMa_002247400 [Elysia marginata]
MMAQAVRSSRRRRVEESYHLFLLCLLGAEFGSVHGLRACPFSRPKCPQFFFCFYLFKDRRRHISPCCFWPGLRARCTVFVWSKRGSDWLSIEWRGLALNRASAAFVWYPVLTSLHKPSDGFESTHTLFASEFMRDDSVPLPSHPRSHRRPRPNCRSGTQTQ